MPKRKTRVMYLPTVDGEPARFDGHQLCPVPTYAQNRFHAVLPPTLREVRQQINASIAFRRLRGSFFRMEYGYVRVEVSDA